MAVEVGQKYSGKVTGITHFGAFIELPENQSGLVHISEVSDGFVKDINTILEVGQEVEVKVLSVATDGKISLSIRQASEKPVAEKAQKPFKKRVVEKNLEDSNDTPTFKKKFDGVSSTNRNSASTYSSNSSMGSKSTSDFDQLMSNFLKDSEDRLTSLKRNTEGKRGGRGGRRS